MFLTLTLKTHFFHLTHSKVKTTSSHFNSAFVLEAQWNKLLTENKNAVTLIQALRKIIKVLL